MISAPFYTLQLLQATTAVSSFRLFWKRTHRRPTAPGVCESLHKHLRQRPVITSYCDKAVRGNLTRIGLPVEQERRTSSPSRIRSKTARTYRTLQLLFALAVKSL
jgi:hypothetical protein